MRYTIQCDYDTSERVGAGGMFQVVSLEDQDGNDRTSLLDVGKHYRSFDEVARDIAKATGMKAEEVELEED